MVVMAVEIGLFGIEEGALFALPFVNSNEESMSNNFVMLNFMNACDPFLFLDHICFTRVTLTEQFC